MRAFSVLILVLCGCEQPRVIIEASFPGRLTGQKVHVEACAACKQSCLELCALGAPGRCSGLHDPFEDREARKASIAIVGASLEELLHVVFTVEGCKSTILRIDTADQPSPLSISVTLQCGALDLSCSSKVCSEIRCSE